MKHQLSTCEARSNEFSFKSIIILQLLLKALVWKRYIDIHAKFCLKFGMNLHYWSIFTIISHFSCLTIGWYKLFMLEVCGWGLAVFFSLPFQQSETESCGSRWSNQHSSLLLLRRGVVPGGWHQFVLRPMRDNTADLSPSVSQKHIPYFAPAWTRFPLCSKFTSFIL